MVTMERPSRRKRHRTHPFPHRFAHLITLFVILSIHPTKSLRPNSQASTSAHTKYDFSKTFQSAIDLYQTHIEPILKHPNERILTPLKNEINSSWQNHSRKKTPSSFPPSLTFLAPAGRVLKLAALSFTASELLAYYGLFGEDGRSQSIATKIQTDVGRLRHSVENWWQAARAPGGVFHAESILKQTLEVNGIFQKFRGLPEKTKFALGATVGMTSSRWLLGMTVRFVKLLAITYIISEVGTHMFAGKDSGWEGPLEGGWEGPLEGGSGGMHKVGTVLVSVRDYIIDNFSPEALEDRLEEIADEEPVSAAGLVVGLILGFLL